MTVVNVNFLDVLTTKKAVVNREKYMSAKMCHRVRKKTTKTFLVQFGLTITKADHIEIHQPVENVEVPHLHQNGSEMKQPFHKLKTEEREQARNFRSPSCSSVPKIKYHWQHPASCGRQPGDAPHSLTLTLWQRAVLLCGYPVFMQRDIIPLHVSGLAAQKRNIYAQTEDSCAGNQGNLPIPSVTCTAMCDAKQNVVMQEETAW